MSPVAVPDKETSSIPEPAEWPIDGTLDLHLFQPKEVDDLVPNYLDECCKLGILQVRIVHGKGTGQLRERVHAILRRMPEVESFSLAQGAMGGWGATVVEMKPNESARENSELDEKG